QGASGAREEVLRSAELLAAPIIKALLGKSVVPDTDPFTTGGIGLLGTRPSQEAMEECDALLIVGSTLPYIEYYPRPGQAHIVQIDRDPARIGLRAPVEVGLVGDARAALEMLNAHLHRKADRSFLERAQRRMQEWRRLLEESTRSDQMPLKPGRLAREVSERISSTAIVTWDSVHNTGLLARYIDAQDEQAYVGSGMMASMGCGVPYAIAAAECRNGGACSRNPRAATKCRSSQVDSRVRSASASAQPLSSPGIQGTTPVCSPATSMPRMSRFSWARE